MEHSAWTGVTISSYFVRGANRLVRASENVGRSLRPIAHRGSQLAKYARYSRRLSPAPESGTSLLQACSGDGYDDDEVAQ